MPRRDPTRRHTRVPRLLERVIQQRRSPAEAAQASTDGDVTIEERMASLEERLVSLENLVEGLQDSVHRESARHQREIEALQHRRAS
jgi:hypothetical protein